VQLAKMVSIVVLATLVVTTALAYLLNKLNKN
jgi:hypothetical protein